MSFKIGDTVKYRERVWSIAELTLFGKPVDDSSNILTIAKLESKALGQCIAYPRLLEKA